MGHENLEGQRVGSQGVCLCGQLAVNQAHRVPKVAGGWAYGVSCTRRGVQDALGKRTPPSQTPEPSAGMVSHTDNGRLCGMVSQEKCDKTKQLILEMQEMVPQNHLLLLLARLLHL